MPVLDWIGKKAVVNHHRDVPYRLIHCDKNNSVGDPDAGNLLVQGDNLEALKALLPYYASKVKCIYIDPPYNTGNEGWVYNDNVNSPEIKAWLGDVVGKEVEDLSRHDKWLCMMLPRLRILKDLLSENGSIFISIDDNEGHYLKSLMDEVFGRGNLLTNVVWQKIYTIKNSARHFSDMHDHILVFAKNINKWSRNDLPRTEKQDKAYTNPDGDPRGPWKATPMHARNYYSKGLYSINSPGGRQIAGPPGGTYWRYSEEKFEEMVSEDRIWWGEDGSNVPAQKRFLSEVQGGVVPTSWWTYDDTGHNAEAKNETRAIFDPDGLSFLTPKPERLVQQILQIATNPGDLVLDSFLGSGTTAAVAHKMGRCYIGIEMGEHAVTHCVPRLKKVFEGEQGGISKNVGWKGGSGFRYCVLGERLFDAFGNVNPSVTFPDLAAHVFFCETGSPIPRRANASLPLIGTFQGRAIYLLHEADWAGIAEIGAGNVLTAQTVEKLQIGRAHV